MKKLFIIIAVLLLPCWVGAETYFLRADGSGSKVDATGSGTGACGAAGTAMSIATHDGETYAAGDTIYLCDDGGVYRDELDVPSSGSNGSPITYTEASGDTPKISGADIVSTWTGVATEETEGAWSSGDADLSSADWNFRMTVAAADIDNDGNSIVLRLEAHSTEDVTVVGAFIGEKASSGDAYDMESGTIEEFLWSSGSGTTVSAGTTSDSDSLTFSYDESKDYIISIGLNDHSRYWTSVMATSGTYFKSGAGESSNAGTANVTGYTGPNSHAYGGLERVIITGGATNQWEAALATETHTVLFDGTLGTEEAGTCPGDLNADKEWCWDSNKLYQYSSSDPDTRYTSPGTEAGQRGYGMELNNKDYITIDGLNVYGANTSGVLVGGGSGNFIIQNNTFEYNAEHGLWISSASDQNDGLVDTNIARYNGEMGMSFHDHFDSNTIRRNTVNNNGYNPGESYTGGIKFWSNGTSNMQGNVFEYNKVYDNTGSSVDSAHGVGIWADLVYAATGNENIIRYNLVYGNDGFGIYLEKSDYHIVHHNVLYDNADAQYTGSIGVKAAGGTTHSSNNLIYNNSISGSNRNGIYCATFPDGGTPAVNNNEFKNNAVDGSTEYELLADLGCDNDGTYGTGNVFNSNSFGAEYTNFIMWDDDTADDPDTYDEFISVSSQTDNNAEGAVNFTDTTDLTLNYSSPAYDSGDSSIGQTYDDCLHPSSSWPSNVTTIDQDLYPRWEIGAYCILKQKGPGVGLMQ